LANWVVSERREAPTNVNGLHHVVETVQKSGEFAETHAVLFDRKKFRLKVIDLAERETVSEGLRRNGALAGTNGGFFHEDRTPLGLVIMGSRVMHPLERAKLLSGMVVEGTKGAFLLRTGEIHSLAKYKEALQAGPFLVDHGKAVTGLNASRKAERTVVIADKSGVVGLLITQPLTLAEISEVLASPGVIPGVKIERALNLDGGSSTAMWIGGEPEFSHSEWKHVRNALGIVPGR
jgi:uncharacterized protein YigE (DUF2233 family)